MGAIVVVTTVGTEDQAHLISRELVARRLAACVNIVSSVRSVYRWQGKICRDSELLLVIKTLEAEFEAVAEAIRELHTYELPEILSFAVDRSDAGFLSWIGASVDKSAHLGEEDDEDDLPFAVADSDDD